MNDICIRIKELRNKTGMSQVEFAKRLGVTNAHISKIEKGGTVPSYALIKLIAKEYKVKEDWIIKGETEKVTLYDQITQSKETLAAYLLKCCDNPLCEVNEDMCNFCDISDTQPCDSENCLKAIIKGLGREIEK